MSLIDPHAPERSPVVLLAMLLASMIALVTAGAQRHVDEVAPTTFLSRAALAAFLGVLAVTLLDHLSEGLPDSVGSSLLLPPAVAAATVLLPRLALLAMRRTARRRGLLTRTLVLVGAGPQGQLFVERARRTPGDLRLIGVFDDRNSRVPSWIAGYPVLGTVDELVAFARREPIDEIVLALPWAAQSRIAGLIDKLQEVAADLRLCPDLTGLTLADRPVEIVMGLPLVTIRRLPFTGRRAILKAVLDRGLALALTLVTAPLLLSLAVSLAVARRGRVLESEIFQDFEGRPIRLHAFVATSRAQATGLGALERLLVASRLDRLPWLLDAVDGRIALVGPRPHAPEDPPETRAKIDGRLALYRIRPGLVCLASLAERFEPVSRQPLERRLALDEAYAEAWSWRLDLQILCRTLVHP